MDILESKTLFSKNIYIHIHIHMWAFKWIRHWKINSSKLEGNSVGISKLKQREEIFKNNKR